MQQKKSVVRGNAVSVRFVLILVCGMVVMDSPMPQITAQDRVHPIIITHHTARIQRVNVLLVAPYDERHVVADDQIIPAAVEFQHVHTLYVRDRHTVRIDAIRDPLPRLPPTFFVAANTIDYIGQLNTLVLNDFDDQMRYEAHLMNWELTDRQLPLVTVTVEQHPTNSTQLHPPAHHNDDGKVPVWRALATEVAYEIPRNARNRSGATVQLVRQPRTQILSQPNPAAVRSGSMQHADAYRLDSGTMHYQQRSTQPLPNYHNSTLATIPPIPISVRDRDATVTAVENVEKFNRGHTVVPRIDGEYRHWFSRLSHSTQNEIVRFDMAVNNLQPLQAVEKFGMSKRRVYNIFHNSDRSYLRKRATHCKSESLRREVVEFILSFAETWPLKYKKDFFLSSHCTFRFLYGEYLRSLVDDEWLHDAELMIPKDVARFNSTIWFRALNRRRAAVGKEEKGSVCFSTFCAVFNHKLKSKVKKLRRGIDECEICYKFYRNPKDEKMRAVYKDHIIKAEYYRDLYRDARHCTDPQTAVLSFDFKSLEYLPRLSAWHKGIVFTSRMKYQFFGIIPENCEHNGVTLPVKFYLTDNNVNAKKTDVVLTCLQRYLDTLPKTIKRVVFFADNASSQNKNRFVIDALQHMLHRSLRSTGDGAAETNAQARIWRRSS